LHRRIDLDAALTRSIELAAQARAAGDHPFGALLLLVHGEVVAEAMNLVATNAHLTPMPRPN
jgi:tRNA(Arg) A34 adenosine deaminase TadA